MKKLKILLLSFFFCAGAMAQNTPWLPSIFVPQTRLVSGVPQYRWLQGANVIDPFNLKLSNISDFSAYMVSTYYNRGQVDNLFAGLPKATQFDVVDFTNLAELFYELTPARVAKLGTADPSLLTFRVKVNGQVIIPFSEIRNGGIYFSFGAVVSGRLTILPGIGGAIDVKEVDPLYSASAAAGITLQNLTDWNGAVSKANTAFGWGNHAGRYVPLADTVRNIRSYFVLGIGALGNNPVNLDNIFPEGGGIYFVYKNGTNAPANGIMVSYGGQTAPYSVQEITDYQTGEKFYRSRNNDSGTGIWSTWMRFWSNVNLNPADFYPRNGNPGNFLTSYTETSSWQDVINRGNLITGAPTVFTARPLDASSYFADGFTNKITAANYDLGARGGFGVDIPGRYGSKMYSNSPTEWRFRSDPGGDFHLWSSFDFSQQAITNWNAAFGWGNHATAGYLKTVTAQQIGTALGYTPVSPAQLPHSYILEAIDGIHAENLSSTTLITASGNTVITGISVLVTGLTGTFSSGPTFNISTNGKNVFSSTALPDLTAFNQVYNNHFLGVSNAVSPNQQATLNITSAAQTANAGQMILQITVFGYVNFN